MPLPSIGNSSVVLFKSVTSDGSLIPGINPGCQIVNLSYPCCCGVIVTLSPIISTTVYGKAAKFFSEAVPLPVMLLRTANGSGMICFDM